MKKLFALLLCTLPLIAHAENSNRYWGLDYSIVDIEVGGTSFDTGAIQAVYGTYIQNPLEASFPVAIEGRVGIGIQDDSSGDVTVEGDYFVGIYARAEYLLSEKFVPYGIIGYSYGKATIKIDNIFLAGEGSDSEHDPSYGFGLRFHLGKRFTVNTEYMLQLTDDVSAVSIGLRYGF